MATNLMWKGFDYSFYRKGKEVFMFKDILLSEKCLY